MTELVSHSSRQKEKDYANDNFAFNETNNAASLNSVYVSSGIPLNCYDDANNLYDKIDTSKQDNADSVILFPVGQSNEDVNKSNTNSNFSTVYKINNEINRINTENMNTSSEEVKLKDRLSLQHHNEEGKESSTLHSMNKCTEHEHNGSKLWSSTAPLRIAYITWNMAHTIPNENEVAAHCIHPNAHIIIVATQENGPYIGDHGPQRAWLHCIQYKCLHNKYTLVATESMSALHLAIFARSRDVARRICYVHTSHVSTGRLWSLVGNKGAVAIAFAISLEREVHKCEPQQEKKFNNCQKIEEKYEKSNSHTSMFVKCNSEVKELEWEQYKKTRLPLKGKDKSKYMHKSSVQEVYERKETGEDQIKLNNNTVKHKTVSDKLVNLPCNCILPIHKDHKRESYKVQNKLTISNSNNTGHVNASNHHYYVSTNEPKHKNNAKTISSCNVATEEASNRIVPCANVNSADKSVIKENDKIPSNCFSTNDVFTILCINAHLAPHQNSVETRNKNYHKIVHNLSVGTKSRYKAFFKECTRNGKANQPITSNNINSRVNDLPTKCNTNPLRWESKLTRDEPQEERVNVDAQKFCQVNLPNDEHDEQTFYTSDNTNSKAREVSTNVIDGNKESNNNECDNGSINVGNMKCMYDKLRDEENVLFQTNQFNNLTSCNPGYDGSSSIDMSSEDVTDQFNVTFFGGDLNYRINGVRTVIEQIVNSPISMHEALLVNDQLNRERARSTVFNGFNEAIPCFRPTYKYEVNASTKITENSYNESKGKPRLPAFCDRVLFKTHANNLKFVNVHPEIYTDVPDVRTSDHRPVVALFDVSIQKNEALWREYGVVSFLFPKNFHHSSNA